MAEKEAEGEVVGVPEAQIPAGADAQSKGIISQLISMVKKLSPGQDLTSQSLSFPEGFEGKESALETFQITFLRHSDILLKANEIEDPVLRLIQVLKWQFTHGQSLSLKKPLNPVLGEVSRCKFYSNQPKEGNKNDGKLKKNDEEKDVFYCVAEQLSHHPPISAHMAQNKERGVQIEWFSKQSIKFTGTSVRVGIEGTARVTLDKFKEVYSYSPPPLFVSLIGFVVEYTGKMEVSCSAHPYVARFAYKEKPVIGGKYHRVKGTIVKVGKDKKSDEEVVKFKGYWNQEVVFEDLRNKKTYTFKASDHEALGIPTYPEIVDEPPESSRKVWQGVKNAPDSGAASKAKREVEEEQRKRAKEREEKKQEHKPKFFTSESRDGEAPSWKANFDAIPSVAF